MNGKQWIFLTLMILSAVLLFFNLFEFLNAEQTKGPLMGMLSNLLLVIAMGGLAYHNRDKR